MLETGTKLLAALSLFFCDNPGFQKELWEMLSPNMFKGYLREIALIIDKGIRENAIINLEYLEGNGIKVDLSKFDYPIGINEKSALQLKALLIEQYKQEEFKALCFEAAKQKKINIPEFVAKANSIEDLSISTKAENIGRLFEEDKALYYVKRKAFLKFGLTMLDSDVKLSPGDVVYIGGYTGSGKSALGLQFARSFSDQGAKTLYINLEMSEKQILDRIIAAETKIELSKVAYNEYFTSTEEKKKFENFKGNQNLYILSGAFNIPKISMEIRRNLPQIVIIDYLQLIETGDKYKGFRAAEVSELSHKIKSIAMDLKIPIIALSQLNRESQKKDEPTVSDLRECGDLEHDASIVLLLWTDSEKETLKHLKVAKNRQGRANKNYILDFVPEYMTFKEHFETPTKEEQSNLPFTAD